LVQILVENGHSWSDIKFYTLSEIGVFLKVILRQKGPEKADLLTTGWLAQHLTDKGLKEYTKELRKHGLSKEVLKKTEDAEIQDNWKRLRGFMGGRR
jgi:hypothetical protein